jgi:hypothetical protein
MVINDHSEMDADRDDRSPHDQVEGDFVAGDEYTKIPQIHLSRLIEVLRQNLPPDDPAPSDLIQALSLFRNYHVRLKDLNELHKELSEILFNYGQFTREVERLSISNEDPEPRAISMHWYPVAQKVATLLDWASVPRSIIDGEPFARLEDRILGPAWAVELCKCSERLDTLVRPAETPRLFEHPRESLSNRLKFVDINELYDAGSDFHDTAERWMYLVDWQLRETTMELLALSQHVLSSLEDD